jgi:hypothetical protein
LGTVNSRLAGNDELLGVRARAVGVIGTREGVPIAFIVGEPPTGVVEESEDLLHKFSKVPSSFGGDGRSMWFSTTTNPARRDQHTGDTPS